MKNNREVSIDALRGIAIIGMVLSGCIAHIPDIPGWMYHAQVGPPDFKFNPAVPGITWVDLVFPFFLFSMGLAFPFSMNRFFEKGGTTVALIRKVGLRTFNLFLFALMLPHLSPYALPESIGIARYLFALMGFVAFFMTFSQFPRWKEQERMINLAGYCLLFLLVLIRWLVFNQPFSIHENDIIILVLANLALFGTIIYIFTRQSWWPRMAVLALYLGLRLTSGIEHSINYEIYHFTPLRLIGDLFPELKKICAEIGIVTDRTVYFSMNFLKYLFIVIPASIVGDILYKASQQSGNHELKPFNSGAALNGLGFVLISFVFVNIMGLSSRVEWLTYGGNVSLLLIAELIIRYTNINLSKWIRNWLNWSYFWLFLGLIFEPFEGGIKKDVATMSYFFMTSGLAGLLLLAIKIAFENLSISRWLGFLPKIGQNPMVGYVAVTFLIIPVLGMSGLLMPLNQWSISGIFPGLTRGILLTFLMIIVTIYTVKIKHFWKT